MGVFEGVRALAGAGLFSYNSPLVSTPVLQQPSKYRRPLFYSTPARCASLSTSAPYVANITDSMTRTWQNIQFRMGRDPRKPFPLRKKVVVLGTGWAAVNFIRNLDVTKFDVTIVSPRNYFTFTPLLPSVCAGTLSPRSCMEPIRDALVRGGRPVMALHEAWATDLNTNKQLISCSALSGETFTLPYDYLVIAVGAETNTFGIPGVAENAYFLKELENARDIHRQLLNNFERASLPTVSEDERRRLLHFVVVGGGPTGVESAAEISDFVREDAKRHFPDLLPYVRVTLVEMLPKVLPMFNESVSTFTLNNLKKVNVEPLLQCRVTKISEKTITLMDSDAKTQEMPYGFVLWASGVAPVPFIKKMLDNSTLPSVRPGPRWMRVDARLRVMGLPKNIYALGDCAIVTPDQLTSAFDNLYEEASGSPTNAGTTWIAQHADRLSWNYPQLSKQVFDIQEFAAADHMKKDEFKALLHKIDTQFKPPPPTAQNATQEGRYLATVFNRYIGSDLDDPTSKHTSSSNEHRQNNDPPVYLYRWRGSMAYVGDGQSVIQTPNVGTWLGGPLTNFVWKLFYWSEQMSITNRIQCLVDWCRVVLRGREVGRDRTLPATGPPPHTASK